VQLAVVEVDCVPAQGHEFGRAQPVPEGDQDYGLVPVTVAVAGAGRLAQPIDLGFGQVFQRPQRVVGLRRGMAGLPKAAPGVTVCKGAFVTENRGFLHLSNCPLKAFCAQFLGPGRWETASWLLNRSRGRSVR
jgi:hypothetical protein